METTVKELEEHGFLDLLFSSKLLGISPDGAANLIGRENGQIPPTPKNTQTLSHVIGIHSVAYMLNLSDLSSIKIGKYINDFDSALKKL
jgi:hypothetical protein